MELSLASVEMPSKAVKPAIAVEAATAGKPTRTGMPATAGTIATTGTPISGEMPAKKGRHQLSATVGNNQQQGFKQQQDSKNANNSKIPATEGYTEIAKTTQLKKHGRLQLQQGACNSMCVLVTEGKPVTSVTPTIAMMPAEAGTPEAVGSQKQPAITYEYVEIREKIFKIAKT